MKGSWKGKKDNEKLNTGTKRDGEMNGEKRK
jgi:hypothetical protein